ncbi:unnamed protein product [Cuscuta epithymum]|uniref:BED-type domain-containing protein n=1 Tax=Cuscuta epithymum TaxID=186058 RepID=A0AAV0FXA6_9ASTE|nr:unnamed protein product [Cuscuta epithymum]CAH9140125.1 unnamed protein product [Cuscuta epithymum]
MDSSSASAPQSQASSDVVSSLPKRNSEDVGWKYGMLCDPKNLDRVRCISCSKSMSGGVYRMKEHIAHITGNVAPCPKATKEDQEICRNAIMNARNKKRKKKKEEDMLRAEVNIDDRQQLEDDLEEELGVLKGPNFLGPMDKFATVINPEASLGVSKKQQVITDTLFKERTHSVQQYCSRWVYEAGIPFNAIDNDSFKLFCEALGQFGPDWVPPTQYQLRETLLKEEVERTKGLLKGHEEEWARNGCSIMTDAWTDRKKRSIMNLCVNCKEGTCFLSSLDASNESHTGEFIFEYVDKCIQEVGPENVVQIVTDNATNNVLAAKYLKEKRPNIFWSGCAAHTIDLMLEGISKLPKFKKVIDQAKTLTIYIYAHHKTLAMMRSFTKKRDIVRPGITRFATCFLTLQSLLEKKSQLKSMFGSDDWDQCNHSKTVKGKQALATVMSTAFWNSLSLCLNIYAPLVNVLRFADGDKPTMGFIYGKLLEAKNSIKEASNNLERNFQLIFAIIEEKQKDRLDSHLHLTAYLLNPYYFYKDVNIQLDELVMDGFLNCVETFYYGDIEKQSEVVNNEINVYKNKGGHFGRALAIKGCQVNDGKFDPANWWTTYGHQVPNLQRLAIKILSLTSSSSGCERNWSTFEWIHSKKRNRLDVKRLNSLVYVQFNAKLLKRKKKEMDEYIDLLASDARNAQGWLVDVNETIEEINHVVDEASDGNELSQPRRSARLRELYDDDFESDSEDTNMDMDFLLDEEDEMT